MERGIKETITAIDSAFQDRLQRKTGWGKNEVLEEFRLSVIDVLADKLNEIQ